MSVKIKYSGRLGFYFFLPTFKTFYDKRKEILCFLSNVLVERTFGKLAYNCRVKSEHYIHERQRKFYFSIKQHIINEKVHSFLFD